MLRRNLLMVLLALCLIVGVGCASNYGMRPYVWDGNLVPISYSIANELETRLNQPLSMQDAIIVASFVNVNNLNESSTFGRIIAEQIASKFAQKGYRIQEVRLRQGSIFMQEGKGEFLLSRELQDISRNHNASAVIVGTFAESLNRIYVSARIVRPSDSIVISSYDVGIPMSVQEISLFLRNK